jgi:lysophospholipase L1-like esterase
LAADPGFRTLFRTPMKHLRRLAGIFSLALLLLPSYATDKSRFQIPATDDGLPGAGPIRRQDWFRKLWAEKRSTWAGQIERDRHAVVFLGDSITQAWGDDLRGAFPGLKVANRGIGGDTTRGVLIRLKEDVLDLDPAAVVLLIGTNDLEEKAEPETIAGNLKLILTALKRHNPKLPVILCQVFPSSATKSRPADAIKKINRLYADARKGDPYVTLLETWPLFADAQGDAKPDEFPDLLHPNSAGYAKWAAALRPLLATLGFLDTEPDTFLPEPGYVSLFNGHDLTGWGYRVTPESDIKAAANWHKNDSNAPPWPIYTKAVQFNGRTRSPDGRYIALHGRIAVTPAPEGRRIQQMWTTNEFPKNFDLKLEFRATPNADSGVFIREPQLQCRDYPLAGPYKDLKNYRPQDWNELEVTVKDGLAYCTCNGEVLEAALKVPPTGPIGLEGDLGQMEYRRIRLKELP